MDNKAKDTEQLREMLIGIELEVMEGICVELERIGRTVSLSEIDYSPFVEEVSPYVDSIRIGETDGRQRKVILDCSFDDITQKDLASFISDGEINFWDLIMLFELLQRIAA